MNDNIETIENPKIGSIVRHTGWRMHDDKYPCDVYITSGNYKVNGLLSNYWYWRPVQEDGSLGEEVCGYGSFIPAEGKYRIEIKVTQMHPFYFTFGHVHRHQVNEDLLFDYKSVALIWAESYGKAREKAFLVFGNKWSHQYTSEESVGMDFYTRGVIEVPEKITSSNFIEDES